LPSPAVGLNVDAIGFCEKLGATLMPPWRLCRVSGDALQAMGRA
jgi:hypothetical protein